MSITSGLVLFAVLWFLILLMVLPIGVRSQEEAGEVQPGTPAGAPDRPMIGRKMLWTTVVTVAVWGLLYWIIAGGIVTRDDLRAFSPF